MEGSVGSESTIFPFHWNRKWEEMVAISGVAGIESEGALMRNGVVQADVKSRQTAFWQSLWHARIEGAAAVKK